MTPRLKFISNFCEAEEQIHVQAFVSQASIEAFYKAVFDRSPRTDEVQLHSSLIGPGIHGAAAKLRAIIPGDRGGESSHAS